MSFQTVTNKPPRIRQRSRTRAKAQALVKSVLPERTAPHLKGGISIFIESVIVLQVILLFLHFMLYETLGAAFGFAGWPIAVLLGLLSLTFISASILATKFKGAFVRNYYKLAGVWFAFVAPLFGACVGFSLTEEISLAMGHFVAPVVAGTIFFGASFILTLYGIWNSGRVEVTNVKVKLPGLPEAWKGRKVVFVSDLQLGDIWGEGLSSKIVRKIMAIQPEAVFIGGDLYDGVRCDADGLIAPLKELHSPLGTYFISGNHEYNRDSSVFFEAIRNAGIRILDNESVDLRGIQLIGVDFSAVDDEKDFEAVLQGIPIDSTRPSILLKHVPEYLDVAARHGVSFQISGHTHRGQFFPLSLVTRHVYDGYDYGLKRFKEMLVYTSSGAGTWMSPFRFGTRSEMVVIAFE
jgi:predicted MPP superfamily phosphohydrolase